MIGIDLVTVDRFEASGRLSKFLSHFRVDGTTALAAAKTWACIEAIIKANDQEFDINKIRIRFPKGCRPEVEDPDQVLSSSYVLSVSHEGSTVIAIALRT